MPSTINIWNASEMSTCAQTGGTWTYTGDILPAPVAPLTYNGEADFTGITINGDYEFTYTIGTSTSQHVVSYGSSQPRVNDTCATAKLITTTIPSFDIFYSDYNNLKCPGYSTPSNSGESYPIEWVYNPTYLDQWYYIDLPAMTCSYILNVILDGYSFPGTGIEAPALALYYSTTGSCLDKVFGAAIEEGTSVQEAVTSIVIPSNEAVRVYIRMASQVAGDFNLNIQAVAGGDCAPVNAPAANTWGYDGGNVFGYDGGNVFGF